ncbi:MAG: 6-carboxytetrahydropterin synthase [Pseudomonadales bacterium]|nr:6-carboxytetrahydropterin synthase [Pseudomonadales bacterium]MDP6470210.1 6-carboxytetrahydropterin synthase [Pseudomonadales bacterium]MDP6827116.1 6-carboxytetrahydropterin synthase [Pseudomonadales bacterium]MDP6971554.1 6-carboxytetrahydropterin synthase [Pseudomonadales bacterium]
MSITTIEISKDYLHFGAAHFTIFSATERENLHGHNFFVDARFTSPVGADGLAFDYNIAKNALKKLCDELDEQVLLATGSPHLRIEHDGDYIVALFAGERIPFLSRDVTLLALANITVEQLAAWFVQQLHENDALTSVPITHAEIRVSSGPGQWASANWSAVQS